ncbi:sugar (and other) transporter family protein [Mycobacterium ulcerans str. Harvey]|uniref:Sugar (And other) transporter family protein n=1 Tax=Mycobacterium ulcerans str. Harvey TaxID=1299332 RepID=A0ABN0R699_MYCUL|nr:sugar (and other) transporter family protein [Mycobacterium ulcerans str. Harvey]
MLPVMVTLDTTVVNVAQRTFIEEFSSTQAVVAWTSTGYTLSLASVIPLTGWTANRLGTKRLVMGSVLLFTLGSLLCAMASSITLLVAFRAAQGLGGEYSYRCSSSFWRARRVRPLGPGTDDQHDLGVDGPIAGPILGGWLIDAFGWQWIFLINLPIGALTLILAGLVLPVTILCPRSRWTSWAWRCCPRRWCCCSTGYQRCRRAAPSATHKSGCRQRSA